MDSFTPRTHRICIVDDDTAVRDSMRVLLECYGYEVQDFASATAFLRAPCAYSCLIADFRMPTTNGLELLELLRMSGIKAPAILMMDKVEPTLAARIRAVGAQALLLKPIAEIELIGAIANACGAHCPV